MEYIIRNLLKNCGFTNVKADGVYSFEKSGLFFINGKGAAHDADVIMNPPIQMPFHYPTQIIFECKAYKSKANLPIVRNALGLRNDLNDFEIVTKKSIRERQNNRRTAYAVETRNRFLYQIGVASINDFTKPAIEFGANNKIPLISLSWFFSAEQLQNINDLTQEIIDAYNDDDLKNVYDYFKDRNAKIHQRKYERAKRFLDEDNELAEIVRFSNLVVEYSYVGLLETGDMVFLFARNADNILGQVDRFVGLQAEIHWSVNRPNVWRLTISNQNFNESEFDFYLPDRLFDYWRQFNLDKSIALNMKQQFFSKIFVFNRRNNPEMPFSIITIDRKWLQQARNRLNEE